MLRVRRPLTWRTPDLTRLDEATVVLASILIVAVPPMWFLGLDQALWLAAGLVLGIGVIRLRGEDVGKSAAVWATFLGVMVVSGLLGAEGFRWITFARNLLITGTFVLAMLSVAMLARRVDNLSPLFIALAIFATVNAILSLLPLVTGATFNFETPIAGLVPEEIASTGLGQASLTSRGLADPSYFGGEQFIRPRGLFLFSTSDALAMAVLAPVLWVAANWQDAELRFWLRLAALAALFALVATTTRSAIIAATVAIVVAWTFSHFSWRGIGVLADGGLLVLNGILFSGIAERVIDLLTSRSGDVRSGLYEATIQGWLERPLLGWGTERSWIPGIPLGSHTWYLGILFEQGVIGLIVVFAGLALLLQAARWLWRGRPADRALVAAMAAGLIVALTEGLWLDPATSLIVAIAFGLVLGLGWEGRTEHPVAVR